MKNLGKTIDQLIQIDPGLEGKLSQIKSKWKRFPERPTVYWKELLDFLNTDPTLLTHPKRLEMRNIIVPKKRAQRKTLSSFDMVNPTDKIIGVIPEHISDRIQRQDQQAIKIAKLHLEANMTKNAELHAKVSRSEMLLELFTKKVWVELKDYFHLWGKQISHTIKRQADGLFVLVEMSPLPMLPASQLTSPGFVKMDPNTLREFLKYLGLNPPQGMFPEEDTQQ